MLVLFLSVELKCLFSCFVITEPDPYIPVLRTANDTFSRQRQGLKQGLECLEQYQRHFKATVFKFFKQEKFLICSGNESENHILKQVQGLWSSCEQWQSVFQDLTRLSAEVDEILNKRSSASVGLVTPPPPGDAPAAIVKTKDGEEDSQNIQHAAKLQDLSKRAHALTQSAKAVVQRPSLPTSLQLCTDVLGHMQARMLEVEGELQVCL